MRAATMCALACALACAWASAAAATTTAATTAATASAAATAAGARPASIPDPAKVVGAEECGQCHESAHALWEGTAHARGWTELARSEAAQQLARTLGITRIKRDERCITCHFLSAEVEGVARPVSGVACESCHGAAADWLDPHWDFGPGVANAEDERPEHREQRLARSEALGMAGPSRIAALGARCYGCHVVAEAELIAAGHPMPGPFDLAAVTQGEIRHNFVRGQGENAVASLERRRLLHVLGRLLDWSETLRGLAAAPEGSEAAARLSARAAELRVLVEGLHDAAPRHELASALAEGADAATIAAAAWALAAGCDGSELGGLDALLPPAPAD